MISFILNGLERKNKQWFSQPATKEFRRDWENMNFELMANSFPLLLAGAAITVEITAMSVTFGLLIGA